MMRRYLTGFLLVVLALLPVYWLTLQRIPNGAEHYYMIDVGETQIVLNTWGTLHATGYPLYVISGNLLVMLLRGLGISAVVAPALVSLLWGVLSLALLYLLLAKIINNRWLAAGIVILFGLTRTVWIHSVIPEIYSFGLVILLALLLLALWTPPIKNRLYWLALIGGIGAFHHRALLMVAPALLYAVWGEITESREDHWWLYSIKRVALCLLLGLLGFLPYVYLPLRAQAGGAWVYGEPGTWDGFWDQFFGREASRFIGAPGSWEGLLANFNTVNSVLITDLTAPGLLLGLAGLVIGLRRHRRASVTLLLSGGAAYLFHIALYTDVLSALILPVIVSAACGWAFLVEALIVPRRAGLRIIIFVVGVCFAALLLAQNWPFIHAQVTNPTGVETIALAKNTPPGSALMLDWGPRHFAVGFARDVLGELPDVLLVDHKADFKMTAAERTLLTPEYTFYNRPASWWAEQLGSPVYLYAVAPRLIEITTTPRINAQQSPDAPRLPTAMNKTLVCKTDELWLTVNWYSREQPTQDLSVFVHLLDEGGHVIAQADQAAPVYGWRPLTGWAAGEIVRDVYALPRLAHGRRVRAGLYRQAEDGTFENVYTFEAPNEC